MKNKIDKQNKTAFPVYINSENKYKANKVIELVFLRLTPANITNAIA
jgi:hypothetical protein